MGSSARGLGVWLVFTAAGLIASVFHLLRLQELYVAPAGHAWWGAAAALLGVFCGALVSRLTALGTRSRPGALLTASALVAFLVSVGPYLAFDRGSLSIVAACVCLSVGAGVMVPTLVELIEPARAALSLGLMPGLLRPSALLGLLAAAAGVLFLSAHAGFLRSGLFLSGWLAVAAGGSQPAQRFLFADAELPTLVRAAPRLGVILLAGAGAVRLTTALPLPELATYPDEIVFASDGAAHRYVVTAAPGGYELFRDGQLAVATLDAARSARVLVLPALESASRRWRRTHPDPRGLSAGGSRAVALDVLLLSGGDGVVERALLDDGVVARLTTVSDDAEIVRLSTAIPFLARLGPGSETGGRLRRETGEPFVWLSQRRDRFDVVVAALPAPVGYAEGKYYTRYYFEQIARHLRPAGIAVFPATSAWNCPDAFASVLATARSAGLELRAYHASIPTLGLESFVLGSGEAFDVSEPLGDMGSGVRDDGGDLEVAKAGVVSTLHEQSIVESFELSRHARRARHD